MAVAITNWATMIGKRVLVKDTSGAIKELSVLYYNPAGYIQATMSGAPQWFETATLTVLAVL